MSRRTPAQMAAETGLSIDTLRYYERIGLLDPVRREASGHRSYSDADVRRVNFLKRVRATGMSIREMQHYVNLFREGDGTITARRAMLEAHRDVVQAQIADLHETLALLNTKISGYKQQEAGQGDDTLMIRDTANPTERKSS